MLADTVDFNLKGSERPEIRREISMAVLLDNTLVLRSDLRLADTYNRLCVSDYATLNIHHLPESR
jgi:hypothetical protein